MLTRRVRLVDKFAKYKGKAMVLEKIKGKVVLEKKARVKQMW